jgi:pimeloyl-ACP methyl ester carboxylesterase
MPYVNVGDTRLFFETYGSKLLPAGSDTQEKPTFIFLHGGAGFLDHTPYINFWSRFSDVCEVIFVDQRGSGRSLCDDKSTWNLKQWGQDIYHFCEALGIEKPIVGGISYGGMVAMSYMMQYPDHPLALILSDTDVHIDREEMLSLVEAKLKMHQKPVEKGIAITNQLLDGPATSEVFDYYFNEVVSLFGRPAENLDDFSKMDPALSNDNLGSHFLNGELLSMDYRDKLSKTQCPVLFLGGVQGPMHIMKTAKELIAAFPKDKIEYRIFEDAKTAGYEAYPEESEKLIKQFIAKL